jgi:hypothetical protein
VALNGRILVGKSHQRLISGATIMEQRCRDGSHNEGNFKLEPFEILEGSHLDFDSSDRRHWSFAFTHASTSSRYILSAIQCFFKVNPFVEHPWITEWIVSETIVWLKVRCKMVLF